MVNCRVIDRGLFLGREATIRKALTLATRLRKNRRDSGTETYAATTS
jgi:hypothetical protein